MMRRIIISTVLLLFAFSLGFVNMWFRSRDGELASADRLSVSYESYPGHEQVIWCS